MVCCIGVCFIKGLLTLINSVLVKYKCLVSHMLFSIGLNKRLIDSFRNNDKIRQLY